MTKTKRTKTELKYTVDTIAKCCVNCSHRQVETRGGYSTVICDLMTELDDEVLDEGTCKRFDIIERKDELEVWALEC